MLDPRAEERTAYHEAGHAFAYWRLGGELHAISIEPNQDRLGEVHGRIEDTAPNDDGTDSYIESAVRAAVVVSYAGRAAEGVLLGWSPTETWADDYAGDWDDRDNADRKLARLSGRADAAVYQRIAYRMIQRNWRKVALLADALRQYRELGGDEAEMLLDYGRGAFLEFRWRFKGSDNEPRPVCSACGSPWDVTAEGCACEDAR